MSDRRSETTFAYDYWQVYLYDAAAAFSPARTEYVEAAKDSQSNGLKPGVSGPVVHLPMAAQWNFDAPMEIVVTDEQPIADSEAWDHVVEFDLDLPSGQLVLYEAGGAGEPRPLPPGLYRARFSGTRLQEAYEWESDREHQPDAYRLQLWPRNETQPPAELKRWPGFDAMRRPR